MLLSQSFLPCSALLWGGAVWEATPARGRKQLLVSTTCNWTQVLLQPPSPTPASYRCSVSRKVALSTERGCARLSCSWVQGWRVKQAFSWINVTHETILHIKSLFRCK